MQMSLADIALAPVFPDFPEPKALAVAVAALAASLPPQVMSPKKVDQVALE